MPAFKADDLYDQLKELDVIDASALDAALEQSETSKVSLDRVLVEKDLISDENLGKIVADMVSLPFVSLSKVVIAKEILFIIPEVVAKKQQIIAFDKNEAGLKWPAPILPTPR